MPNITLSVDKDVIKKVRKVAIDRNTTLTAMVREYLEEVAARDQAARERALFELERSLERLSRPMGSRTWSRDELHER